MLGLVATVGLVQSAQLGDLPVIVLYTLGLVIAALLLVPAFRLQRLRMAVVPVMVVAALPGVLDLGEDGALALALDRQSDIWFLAATALAVSKFVLLVVVLPVLGAALCSAMFTPTWLHRRLIAPPEPGTKSAAEHRTGLGIALSGGGVRAATYSLGTLQALEDDQRHPLGWEQTASPPSRAAPTWPGRGSWARTTC